MVRKSPYDTVFSRDAMRSSILFGFVFTGIYYIIYFIEIKKLIAIQLLK